MTTITDNIRVERMYPRARFLWRWLYAWECFDVEAPFRKFPFAGGFAYGRNNARRKAMKAIDVRSR